MLRQNPDALTRFTEEGAARIAGHNPALGFADFELHLVRIMHGWRVGSRQLELPDTPLCQSDLQLAMARGPALRFRRRIRGEEFEHDANRNWVWVHVTVLYADQASRDRAAMAEAHLTDRLAGMLNLQFPWSSLKRRRLMSTDLSPSWDGRDSLS